MSNSSHSQSDKFQYVCLFSLCKGGGTGKDRQDKDLGVRMNVCVCVSLDCLPQRPTVGVKEILHLAPINRWVLFISHSTSMGYLFRHRPSTSFPCLTLKPDSNTHCLLNPPHPPRSFPFGPLLHRNAPDQHLITTTPQPRIESRWLHNKTLSMPTYFTPSSVSHLVLLGNASRSYKGDHVWGS